MQALVALHTQLNANKKLSRNFPQDVHQELNVLVADLMGKLKEGFSALGGVTFLGTGISFCNKNKGDPEFKLVARTDYNRTLSRLQKACKSVSIRLVVDDPEAIFSADDRLNENLVAALVIAADELTATVSNFKCITLN